MPLAQICSYLHDNRVGAFEHSSGEGLSFNAFMAWSKKLPALLTSLRSLLAAGSIETGSAATTSAVQVMQCLVCKASPTAWMRHQADCAQNQSTIANLSIVVQYK